VWGIKPISKKRVEELKYRQRVYLEVMVRDRETCVACGENGNEMHEICARSRFGHKNMKECFQVKNMVCLCRECHAKAASFEMRRSLITMLRDKYKYVYDTPPWSEYV